MPSQLASLPGAVVQEGEGVPAHYGQPFAEEHRLLAGKAFTDLSHIEVVKVSGVDRKNWLHNITSRDFNDQPTGACSEVVVLDPNGHIQELAATVDDGEATWLLTDQGRAEPLATFLEQMKFMMRVEVEVLTGRSVLGVMVEKKDLPAQVVEMAELVWEDPWPRTLPGGADYGIKDEDHPAAGHHRTLLVLPEGRTLEVAEALAAAGYTPAGLVAWEAARVADRRPRPNREVVERSLPHELDLLRTAVHLEKGCYRGQETVAKIVNLGKPPRRLTYLYLEGPDDELPAPGTEILGENDRAAGVLTSVVRDADEGPVALALLKRSTKVDAPLHVGEFVLTQEVIVSPEGKSSASPESRPGAGLSSQVPRQPRLGQHTASKDSD